MGQEDNEMTQDNGLVALTIETPMDLIQAIKDGLPDDAAIDILLRMCREAFTIGVETGRMENVWDLAPLELESEILH